jgi:hypothetical protein
MKKVRLGRWVLVGVVVVLIAAAAISQSQQRVQSTQLTVAKPVLSAELTAWRDAYSEAMKVAREIKESGSAENGTRLENDLKALDEALREYVRVSERLRHKDRALSDTMQFLALQNNIQQQSRQYQTISNALTAAHQAESAAIRNLK